ncbi:hypothetical protein D9M71_685600 [compost metagenome]
MFRQGHATQYVVGAAEIALGENFALHAIVVEQPGNAAATAGQFVLNAFVLLQVVEGLRCTGPLEVVGAGNHYQRSVFQLPGDQAGIRNGAHADGHVITFTDEIDVAVTDMRLDLNRRKTRAKGRQQRQDAVMGISGGNADAQGS